MTYRPLPNSLTVANSNIDGLGLFAKEDIEANTQLGLFHYYINNSEIIRTPLAGFCNHSKNSNCSKVIIGEGPGARSYLITKTNIKKGEELTLTYDLYKPQ